MFCGDSFCGSAISDNLIPLLSIQADSVINIEYYPEYIIVTKWRFSERSYDLSLENRVYKFTLPIRDGNILAELRELGW